MFEYAIETLKKELAKQHKLYASLKNEDVLYDVQEKIAELNNMLYNRVL